MVDQQESQEDEAHVLYLSHSRIDRFPPPYNLFPRFYHAREAVFVLQPGDALYIPPGWCHWVFSYPDAKSTDGDGANLAISFPVTDFAGKVQEPFSKESALHLNVGDLPFLEWTLDRVLPADSEKIHRVLLSKGTTLHNVGKQSKNRIKIKMMNNEGILATFREGKYNVSLGQNDSIFSHDRNLYKESRPPDFWIGSFPGSKMRSFLWITVPNSELGIDSGLHYDSTHGLLIQIRGVKIVRLYPPSERQNLYIGPLPSGCTN